MTNVSNKIIDDLNDGSLFEMTNLVPKRTGLNVDIWSDHKGVLNKNTNYEPQVKIGKRNQFIVSVSISNKPKILYQTKYISKSDMSDIQEAIKYVARNYDLFLKHYNDTNDEFDDEDLFNALQDRGNFKD